MTDSAPARSAMIDAAEALVAERGLAATSVREVQQRAGQSNKNAVTYHFGSRQGLLEAVVDARMGPVNHRRWQLLERLEATAGGRSRSAPDGAGGHASTRRWVEAFVLPLAAETLDRPNSRYARFLLQAVLDPVFGEQVQAHVGADSFRAVRDHLVARSTLPRPVARLRVRHLVNLTTMTLATWEGRTQETGARDAVVADLLTCCTALLEATPTPVPAPVPEPDL